MYCTKCGHQILDGEKFCVKCGQMVGGNASRQSQTTVRKKKGGSKAKLIAIGAIIVVLLMVIFVLAVDRDNISDSSETFSQQSVQGEENAQSDGFSYEAVLYQCYSCKDALGTLAELSDEGAKYGYNESKIETLTTQKYNQMQHDCSAEVIEVQDMPYMYRNCYGTYSGQWKGAGPTGSGTFVGKTKLTDDLISYTGEWAYGLPEGEGELCVENFLNHAYDMNYEGDFVAGNREGLGYLYEYIPNYGYRIYDQGQFQNDTLVTEVNATLYDIDTGEIKEYSKMIGDDQGDRLMTQQWNAGELSPSQKNALETAATVALVAVVAYAVNYVYDNQEAYDYDKANSEMLADLDNYRAQKEKDRQETEEKNEAAKEKFRQDNEDLYNEAINSYDPDGTSWQTQIYKYNAGY